MFVYINGKQGERTRRRVGYANAINFYVGLHVHDIVYIEYQRIDVCIYIRRCTVYVRVVRT